MRSNYTSVFYSGHSSLALKLGPDWARENVRYYKKN